MFEKAGKLCLCGLQAINGLEGAWGLVVWFLVYFGFGSWIREHDAEDAKATQKSQKEMPKLFENTFNQCLCGLQGINDWEGAWELVVWFLRVYLDEYGNVRRSRKSYAEVAEEIPKLFEKAYNQYPCGLQAENGLEGA